MGKIIREIIEIITVSITIYILFIVGISVIKTILYIHRHKVEWKDKFRELFLDFFYEILNPINWFL